MHQWYHAPGTGATVENVVGYGSGPSSMDLANLSKDIITAARTGDYAGAARNLNRFLRLLQGVLSKGTIGAADMAKITYSLQTLLAMQQMRNWVAFADVLEYEFMPLLAVLSPKNP